MDETTWGALALVLTLLGGAYTWWAVRHRGAAAATRGAAFTLLPPAAFLTGTLEMFTEIGGSVADWATALVLSPRVWVGVVLAGLAVVLYVVGGLLHNRSAGAESPEKESRRERRAVPAAPEKRPGPVVDDDLADIEAILKRRGIT